MVDTYTRLCGTGQALTPTTAGVLSTDYMDLGSGTYRNFGGNMAVASFCASVSMNSSTENATMRLQIVALPKTGAIAALTAFNNTSDVAGAVITSAAHGLTNGTRVTVAQTSGTLNTTSSGGGGPTYAVSTNLYVVNATTNTFGLSGIPNGTPFVFVDQTGTTTVTWYPEILVDSGEIGIDRIQAGLFKYEVAIPPPQVSPKYPYNRYIYARFVPSATITAGTMTCDINEGYSTNGGILQTIGYTTA